jgi:hypothetical protein
MTREFWANPSNDFIDRVMTMKVTTLAHDQRFHYHLPLVQRPGWFKDHPLGLRGSFSDLWIRRRGEVL